MPKGVYCKTEEHKRKLSQALLGRKYNVSSDERERKSKRRALLNIINPPTLGRKRTEQERINISRGHKGLILSEEVREKIRTAHLGKKLPLATRKKMSLAHRGAKSSFWKGGITLAIKLIRTSSNYKQWRTNIFTRDKFTCQHCGNKGIYLEVHHIKPVSQLFCEAKQQFPLFSAYDSAMAYNKFWDINNGITLCKKCHHCISSKQLLGNKNQSSQLPSGRKD